MASARTSDHHPIPMQATRKGLVLTTFALPLSPSHFRLLGPRSQLVVSSRTNPRACSILDLTRFLDANRFPPRIKVRGWLLLENTLFFPAHPDRLDSRLGDAQIRLPVAATDPDAANTLAVDQHRHTTFHGRPSLRSGGERPTDRLAHVEVLTGRSLGRGR